MCMSEAVSQFQNAKLEDKLILCTKGIDRPWKDFYT